MDLERKNLKYVKTTGQYDYYLTFDIGEDITSEKMLDYNRMVCVDNTSPDGQMLRKAHNMPGHQIFCSIRNNYEGTPQIIDTLIKSIGDDKEIYYHDTTTGAEVRLSFSENLASKHMAHFGSLASEALCKNIEEIMRSTAEGREDMSTMRMIERQEIRKRVSDKATANIAKGSYSKLSSASHIFDAFTRKEEFEKVPRDLFLMYTIMYRPSLGRDAETGEKTYLPSLFKDAEEEATFMRTLINHTDKSNVLELSEEIQSVIPGISKDASDAIAGAYVRCSASSKSHIRELYDQKILLTQDPDIQEQSDLLRQLGSQMERVLESNGKEGLVNILSGELRDAINKRLGVNSALTIQNLSEPRIFKCDGQMYEIVTPNPNKPNDMVIVGPSQNLTTSIAQELHTARQENPQLDPYEFLHSFASKTDMDIAQLSDFRTKKIVINDNAYVFGDNGSLYDASVRAANIDSFVATYLQKPTYDFVDYSFDMNRLVELSTDENNKDAIPVCELPNGIKASLLRMGDGEVGEYHAFSNINISDMPPMPDAKKEAWISENPGYGIPDETIATAVDNYLTGDPIAREALLEYISPEGLSICEANKSQDLQKEILKAIQLEAIDKKLLELENEYKSQLYDTLLAEGSKTPNVGYMSNTLGDFQGFVVVDGTLMRQIPDDSPELEAAHKSLLDASRGVFTSPDVAGKQHDGEWHEGDVQKIPTLARDILHDFRKSVKEKYGQDFGKLVDTHFFELMSDCSSEHADTIKEMTEKDLVAYHGSAINLFINNNRINHYAGVNVETMPDYDIDQLIDCNLSYDGSSPKMAMKNNPDYSAEKELYAQSWIDVMCAKMTPVMELEYGRMVMSPDINTRLQMPLLGVYTGDMRELSMTSAHLTEEGEHTLNMLARHSVREHLKAFAYIKDNCKEGHLPSGDKVDLKLVDELKKRLPPKENPKEYTAKEFFMAAGRISRERADKTGYDLLSADKKEFKDKAIELHNARKKKLENMIQKVSRNVGNALLKPFQALEGL